MFNPLALPTPDLDTADSIWVPVRSGTILCEPGGGFPTGTAPDGLSGDHHFLGALAGRPVWAIDLSDSEDEAGLEPVHLRQLHGRLPDLEWTIAGRAEQIIHYEQTHRFCGRCATPTDSNVHDRGRKCPSCGLMAFPRLSPAMIVLIERGDEILLAWGRQFPGRFFSTLAGFVEPGESLEQAVEREIMEEVGITVSEVNYFGSQPWPFPHSLMCGFTCVYESGEIVIQEEEIVEADWFQADDLPPCPVGGSSIAGWMIAEWLEKKGVEHTGPVWR